MLLKDPEFAQIMATAHPTSYKALIRLADTHQDINPKLAALAYAQALPLDPSLGAYISRRMRKLISTVQWGPLVTEEELATLPAPLRPLLLKNWSPETRSLASTTLCTASVESRSRFLFQGKLCLPRFFSWILPQRLAAMSTPKREADIDTLATMGVTTVLTLTEEEPLDSRWFAFRSSIRNIFIPVQNYEAPSTAEMDLILSRFSADQAGVWLVHCGGGKGRAGTVVACLMAMQGVGTNEEISATPRLNKTDVITLLREMRPGSIETVKQEAFIGNWIKHRWRLAYEKQDEVEEPAFGTLRKTLDTVSYPTGLNADKVHVIFLIGLPGSGKSWLSSAIQKRRAPGKTVIISQDETRSRDACETAFGQAYNDQTLVILDKCNPDPADRRLWLRLIHSSRKPVAIHFDYPSALCLRRIDDRLSHPTVPVGGGANAVKQMARLMQPPRLDEGFGAILTVDSFAAAWEAVLLLGGSDGTIIKFPRTPHLLNLGAVTADDLVHNAPTADLQGALVVEEKIDGANMGFSLSPHGHAQGEHTILVQNRSHWLDPSDPTHAQFRPLRSWLGTHGAALGRLLGRDDQFPDRFILYGEWVVARHSIRYTRLPNAFLAFDLFDRVSGTFASRELLTRALDGSGILQVPLVWAGERLAEAELRRLVTRPSRYCDGPVEGVYVRFENAERTQTVRRGKVVRGDFITGDEHWNKRPLVLNGIHAWDEGTPPES